MSDPPNLPADAAPETPGHPVDAVLAALRAVPDSVLRDLEPATGYVPGLVPPGGCDATATAPPASGGDR